MKHTLKNLIVIGSIAVGLSSCSKELDLYPYNSIELSQSLKTVKDAKAYNGGLFSSLRGAVYGLFTYSQDVQADQLNASIEYGNRNGNPHRWGSSFLADDYTIRDVWQGYYSRLKNVNYVIAGYPTLANLTPAEKAEVDVYLGNAYAIRAYYYHELVIRYAKPYNASSASTDLGVPLVLTYDILSKPPRATVQEVYTQILDDINTAKGLLSSVAGKKGATTFTAHSILALEARVKLHMGDWEGAKAAAETVINSGTYPLYTTADDLKSMWVDDANQETIQQIFVSKPQELANTNNIYLGYVAANDKFRPDFIPSQWVIDMYDNSDLRKNVYFEKKEVDMQGVFYSDIWLVNKFAGNPALFTAATTNYQQAPRLFRVAELYLIAAEAAANLGGANETAARTHLNTLRQARGLSAIANTVTGSALMTEIKDERFRELAFEGFRLWDLKRWNEGFTRRDAQNLDIINVGASFNTLSIPANDPKFVWAIPTNDMTTNPSLEGKQNPGW